MPTQNEITSQRGVDLSLGTTESSADNQSEIKGVIDKIEVPKGITLAALAEHSGLPAQFLQSIGVTDNPGESGEVLVRYHLANNELARVHRIRTALTATEGDRWTQNQIGPIVPYGLGRLSEAKQRGYLVLVMGEADCWPLWHHGVPALGIPGAKMITILEAEHLAGVPKIYVVKEPDKAGTTFVTALARRLKEVAWHGEALVISMPKDLKDPSELHKLEGTRFRQKFQELVDAATPLPMPENDAGGTKGSQDQKKRSLVDIASAECTFFRTCQSEPFAVVRFRDHKETWGIATSGYREWLSRAYYAEHGTSPSQEELQGASNVFKGKAKYEGEQHEVFTRVGELGDAIYLDLCDDAWRAVEITANGWRVVVDPPVRFRRSNGMQPLPEPTKGGSAEGLRRLLNLNDDHAWILLLGYMVQALRPKGPYLHLILQGEQGTAKSTTARLIRSLIDPARPPYSSPPRSEQELMIRSRNSWIVSLDNLSGLQVSLSDALCRLSTGGGLTTRKLYTDADEEIFDLMRSAIMNGIGEVAHRQDLLDRSIIVRLEPIDDSMRRTEVELMTEFHEIRSQILGVLLDGVSAALRRHKDIVLPEKPRMADAVVWATAAETGLGLDPGSFLRAYNDSRARTVGDSLSDDPLAIAVRKFMGERAFWKGTATELLAELRRITTDNTLTDESLPKVNRLSIRLDQSASFLRRVGLDVRTHQREGHESTRVITIKKTGPGTDGIVGMDESPIKSPDRPPLAAGDTSLGVVGPSGLTQEAL